MGSADDLFIFGSRSDSSSKDTTTSGYHPEDWTPEEIAFVASKENLASLYERGKMKYSPEEIIERGYSSAYFTSEEYSTFVEEWHAEKLAENQELIDAGVPEYTLDPTPWDDEITTWDQKQMTLLQTAYEEEQTKIAELEARKEASRAAREAATEQRAINLERIEELATLRGQSEELAIEDVRDYINETSQQLKLRGITPAFTEETREELIQSRFTEYWSQENEQQLMDLAGEYIGENIMNEAADLPTISDRVWRRGDIEIKPVSEIVETTEETSAITTTMLESVPTSIKSLLEEENELLGTTTLLGS